MAAISFVIGRVAQLFCRHRWEQIGYAVDRQEGHREILKCTSCGAYHHSDRIVEPARTAVTLHPAAH